MWIQVKEKHRSSQRNDKWKLYGKLNLWIWILSSNCERSFILNWIINIFHLFHILWIAFHLQFLDTNSNPIKYVTLQYYNDVSVSTINMPRSSMKAVKVTPATNGKIIFTTPYFEWFRKNSPYCYSERFHLPLRYGSKFTIILVFL